MFCNKNKKKRFKQRNHFYLTQLNYQTYLDFHGHMRVDKVSKSGNRNKFYHAI